MVTTKEIFAYIREHTEPNATIHIVQGDSSSLESVKSWMFRAETDDVMASVCSSKEFILPPDDKTSVVGNGGLFFACDIPHVINYAKGKDQEKQTHFFVCPQPMPERTYDNYTQYPMNFISHDTLVRNVRSGCSVGDEFIKAGHGGCRFRPSVLVLVKLSQRLT